MGNKGAERVANGLDNPCRQYYKLYLCDNRIGWEGASLIANSLRCNSTLLELSLGNNCIEDEGVKSLADALKFNNTLGMLNVENNEIGARGAWYLAEALEENTALQWLVLSENPLGDEGLKALLSCIRNVASLNRLEKCNHSLLSIVLKKVTGVKVGRVLRDIKTYLKINRISVPSANMAARRKIRMSIENSPQLLLEFIMERRRADDGGDGDEELKLQPFVLSFCGEQSLSTVYSYVRDFNDWVLPHARRMQSTL
jgi:hypothetical protein